MKNMFNVTTVLPHCATFPDLLRRPENVGQLRAHLVKLCRALSDDLCREVVTNARGSFARGCEAKRWSHWTCSSLGIIFQPMKNNSVPDVKCFCNNKNVLCAQSMVWHFVRHPLYLAYCKPNPRLIQSFPFCLISSGRISFKTLQRILVTETKILKKNLISDYYSMLSRWRSG